MGIEVGNPPGQSDAVRPAAGDHRGLWFRPPRLRTLAAQQERRHATWLEPLFDLVFVVAIAELGHQLVVDHSTAGFLRFAGLFIPVFVAWQGFMAYADRFDTDDLAVSPPIVLANEALAGP